MRRFACSWLLPIFSAFLPNAAAAECDPRLAKSPQFTGPDCTFANPPNPNLKPHRSNWDIWSRFALAKKEGTVPVDPIPVRRLDRAALAALDMNANHIIRLGHSSHLLKLRGKWWLMFGQRASPLTWAGPKRFHAPPVALEDVPPIRPGVPRLARAARARCGAGTAARH